MERKFIITGIILILISIILGAFGAHSLKVLLENDPDVLKKISSFETGVRYQMYSGLSFLIIGLNKEKFQFSLKPVFYCWLVGTIFFSVSIYFLTLQTILELSLKFLGPITPLGGLLLIIGWGLLLLKFLKQPKKNIQNQESDINDSNLAPAQSNTQPQTPNTLE